MTTLRPERSATAERYAAGDAAWGEAWAEYSQAAERIGLDDGMVEMLGHPRRAIEVAVPFRRDDGSLPFPLGKRWISHSIGHPSAKPTIGTANSMP